VKLPKKIVIQICLLPLLIASFPQFVLAQAPAPPNSLSDLANVLATIIKSVTAIAVLLSFIMILIGGFQFLFSGGDQKAVEKARNTLTWALIGIVILILIWFVLLAVFNITGVPVMNFYIGNPLG